MEFRMPGTSLRGVRHMSLPKQAVEFGYVPAGPAGGVRNVLMSVP
jgi:hypothetical protein